jgi:bacillaene synthase trans-acting acyltransferase
MFSGQGSHYFQMGRALFEHHAVFRDWMLRLDGTVRAQCGESVVEQLYDGRSSGEIFDRTLLTHPAIFMIEYALVQSLRHAGVFPDLVLGASLGSWAAAASAGCIDFEPALKAVVQQARAFDAHCEPGGMIAVLANAALFDEDFFRERSELAAVNFSTHFVVSAPRERLPEIEAELQRRNVVYQRLAVSQAFHSRWIDPARQAFAAISRETVFRQARIPLVCCERGGLIAELPAEYSWHVARNPIRFREAVAAIERLGAHRYVDVGPAGTLATFLKYQLPPGSGSKRYSVLSPYGRDRENLAALLADFDTRC